jgi:hypothetical protein
MDASPRLGAAQTRWRPVAGVRETMTETKSDDKKTYEIVEAGMAIKCLICNMVSYSHRDVEELYCGYCHRFHSEG